MIFISRSTLSGASEAWAVLTITLLPKSRRTVPPGAFDGSVGPSTERILLIAFGPSSVSYTHLTLPTTERV